MRVGLDFDNTSVRYDELFSELAAEEAVPGLPATSGKSAIRDTLRNRHGGELIWHKLQAMAYGVRIDDAKLYDGVKEYLAACLEAGIEVFVVSHKSRWPAADGFRVDLRKAALRWMEGNGLFGPDIQLLKRENVYFEDTRRDKVARILELECFCFIDDLVEVFEEPGFPKATRGVLFAPDGATTELPIEVFQSWSDITNDHFGQSAVA